MTSVDTNILVRFFTRDDEHQYQKACNIFQTEQVYVPDTVILETEWVLRFAYEFREKEISKGLNLLFGLPNVQCANPMAIQKALRGYARGLDFADALHLSLSHSCKRMVTFDKAFVKKAKGLSECVVAIP